MNGSTLNDVIGNLRLCAAAQPALHEKMAAAANIKRARVRCDKCGSTQTVDGARSLALGWPRCCGYTMTLLPTTLG